VSSKCFLQPIKNGIFPTVPPGVDVAIAFDDDYSKDGMVYVREYHNGQWSKPFLFGKIPSTDFGVTSFSLEVPSAPEQKVTKVKIVRDLDLVRFESECNKMLEAGWELHGNMESMFDPKGPKFIQMFVFKE